MKNVLAYRYAPRDFSLNNRLNIDPGSEWDDRGIHTVWTDNGFAWDDLIGFDAVGREDLRHLPLWTIDDMEAFRDQDTPQG